MKIPIQKLKVVLFLVLVISTPLLFLTFKPDVTEVGGKTRTAAEVLEVIDEGYRFIPGTGVESFHQTLNVKITKGDNLGEIVEIESELYELNPGDRIFLDTLEGPEGEPYYIMDQPDRRLALLILLSLFTIAILSFGFWKGVRSLLSLTVSLGVIIFLLLPKLLEGAPPVLTTVIFASFIMALTMYITHGFNRVTHSAFLGTAITLALTGMLSYLSVSMAKLSGFASHEALYLNLQTGGLLDISGLLLGAIIIGVLGILDDVSITQSATVRELYRANSSLSSKEVYTRALSVGKEHIISLVNTLALAYAGASLPLLLLLSQSEEGFGKLINMEIFATEITRTLVGSIGLIIAVPITTLLATVLLKKKGS